MNASIVFVLLHLFIYPASNAYNSFQDKDSGPIGMLEHPPMATQNLYHISLVLDLIGLGLAALISPAYILEVAVYILVSKAYSYRGIRLKKYPIVSFLVVAFFQGGYTFLLVYQAVNKVVVSALFHSSLGLPVIVASLLVAGVYPLTQVYQHAEDSTRGDRTLSLMLGVRGTFLFTGLIFGLAALLLGYYWSRTRRINDFFIFLGFLAPVGLYFGYWFYRVWQNASAADFRSTMRMNLIASSCMTVCFVLLLLFK